MHQPRELNTKIYSLGALQQEVNMLKEQGKKIVFTNGCFDILHRGHVQLLQEARSLGDVLVVAVNSDSSVRALKGAARPVTPQQQRAEIMASLEHVDYVVIFNELDPLQVITALQPQVLVKGGDWAVDSVVGRDVVENAGGTVHTLPLRQGASTSAIIKKIITQYGH